MDIYKFFDKNKNYTKLEERIIDYFYDNIDSIFFMTIGEISKDLNISQATISRFVRHAGYSNFKSLKNAILSNLGKKTPGEKIRVSIDKNIDDPISSFYLYQQNCINKTFDMLDLNVIDNISQSIIDSKNIFLYGKGAAKSLCDLLKFRLKRFGKNVIIMNSSGSEMFEDLINIRKDDLVIIFSFENLSKEVEVILSYAKKVYFKTAIFTRRKHDKLLDYVDFVVNVYRGQPNEYHSMAAPVILLDSLVILTAYKMGEDVINKLEELHCLKDYYIDKIPR